MHNHSLERADLLAELIALLHHMCRFFHRAVPRVHSWFVYFVTGESSPIIFGDTESQFIMVHFWERRQLASPFSQQALVTPSTLA